MATRVGANRFAVYDSYDFLSHHRRQTHQYAEDLRAFGVVDNWYRFAIDLVPIDEAGRMFKGEGARIEDWYGWGLLGLAPSKEALPVGTGDVLLPR